MLGLVCGLTSAGCGYLHYGTKSFGFWHTNTKTKRGRRRKKEKGKKERGIS